MSGIIRLLPNQRTNENLHVDDLMEVQIMDTGASEYKQSAYMKVSDVAKYANSGVTPLRFKALFSQNAPILNATSKPAGIKIGQIYLINTHLKNSRAVLTISFFSAL